MQAVSFVLSCLFLNGATAALLGLLAYQTGAPFWTFGIAAALGIADAAAMLWVVSRLFDDPASAVTPGETITRETAEVIYVSPVSSGRELVVR